MIDNGIDTLLSHDCQERLSGAWRLFVGFSGGLDSTVLLHILATQPAFVKKITAVHINHGLSANALDWEGHCQQVCQSVGVPLIVRKITIDPRSNVEEEARKGRYSVFHSLLGEGDALVLAHHRDDQAETLLLQLFRGAGIDGLSAMPPIRQFAKAQILRPLLHCSRQRLEIYAQAHQLKCVNDESNTDSAFSRNFLRNDIIPLLKTRWPGVLNNLARTANHCRNAETQLNELAEMDYPTNDEPINRLSLAKLHGISHLRITNILRVWFKKNAVRFPDTATFNRIIPEVIFASPAANPELIWDAYCVRRYQQTLYLLNKEVETLSLPVDWRSFPMPLSLPADLGRLKATLSEKGLIINSNSNIQIRFRKGGETILWHGQTKSLKKLFQEWQVPTWLRGRIPLLYVNEQLAAVIGYAISDLFYQSTADNCYQITYE